VSVCVTGVCRRGFVSRILTHSLTHSRVWTHEGVSLLHLRRPTRHAPPAGCQTVQAS